jgi:hypothetical protein
VNVPNGKLRVTQELLDVVDDEHRKNGWEWTDLTELPEWFGLPDATGPTPEGVITQLFDLFVEAGLHAMGRTATNSKPTCETRAACWVASPLRAAPEKSNDPACAASVACPHR